MVFNATFNNMSAISWRSVLNLLVEETGRPGENLNRKIVERSNIDTTNTPITLTILTWHRHFGIKSGGIKLVVWAKTSAVSKMIQIEF